MRDIITTKISRRVSLAMIAVVSVIIFIFAFVLSEQTFRSLERELRNRAAIIAKLAEKSLPMPMWNVDEKALNDFLDALLTDETIAYAEYEIMGNAIVTATMNARHRPEFEGRAWAYFEQSPQFLPHSVTIIHKDTPLGFIRFAVSEDGIRHDLRQRVFILGAEVLLIIMAITLTSIVITSRSILMPLNALQHSANRLAQGELDYQIDTNRRDELGRLARSFADMRDAIRQKMIDLQHLNDQLYVEIEERTRIEHELSDYRDHLEEMVTQRTAELAQATKDAENARQLAEDANRAKSVFLANMSHELRTPLNAIIGFAQLLQRDANILFPETQENISIIYRSGEHLLTLINQVLDLTKDDVGRLTLNLSDCDLFGLLADIESFFSLKIKSKSLSLTVHRADDVPQYIRADAVKLRQVLLNLLNNAVKFTDAGGIAVRVRRLPSDAETHILSFEIEDTGRGIATEELPLLFQPFMQTESGRQSQEGTGLGLTLCRKFVTLMGGNIDIRSALNRGTTVMFSIHAGLSEMIESPRRAAARYAIALEPGQPRYRLLIVDDKPDNRTLLIKLLMPFGFDMREARNGQEAVDISQEWPPHLIFMDLRMPILGGYEAVSEIRRRASENAPVIIALSASSIEEELSTALSKGCQHFLRKPFQSSEIFESLERFLGVRFVYEDDPAASDGMDLSDALTRLTPAALAALPDDLREELRYAVRIVDFEQLTTKLAERIRPYNAPFADAIARVMFEYRVDLLDQLFQQSEQ